MIEIFSKKKMVLAIVVLCALFILVLIFESTYLHTPDELGGTNDVHDHHPILREKLTPANKCWKNETYHIVKECDVCTEEEIRNNSPIVCVAYGFKELVKCASGKESFRSCPKVTWLESRKFWRFEGIMIFLGVCSSFAVFVRQKQLNHKAYQRIQRQIASGA